MAKGDITFVGDKYGKDRDAIIKGCMVAVHPSIYDSGGMALAHCMSFGLPGVSFNLPALCTYYPKGVVKVPCFDKKKFSEEIIRLLEDKEHYERISKEAKELIENYWRWGKRVEDIWQDMMLCLSARRAGR
jgi:glycosyltransferase involved in cell wall biosynthesis